ncbi:MAG: helix-turn-helix domain-containing protein [Deltaproteobacteria bacterium]|nr:helix-turn-helix domain-containing protein [Deltaproteobacteria bacterium]MBK9367596.1 helix-turn-helix domain-containing protein [Deltaproteobacteria bacterium]MBK9647839.1 helix-turn-helix domain-containing protein [Deltaproteobacteria bacterium]
MPLLSLYQAAEILAVSPETLRRWAAARRVASVKLGRRLLFDEEALRAWVLRQTRAERPVDSP